MDEGCDDEVPDELQDSDEPVFRLWCLRLIGTVAAHGITPQTKGPRAIIQRPDFIWTWSGTVGADPVTQHAADIPTGHLANSVARSKVTYELSFAASSRQELIAPITNRSSR